LVARELAEAFADPLALIDRWKLDVPADAFDRVIGRIGVVAAQLRAQDANLVRDLVAQVRVDNGSVEIACDRGSLAEALGIEPIAQGDSLKLTVSARLTRSGLAMRLVHGGMTTPAETHRSLARLIVQARGWWKELRGGVLNVSELAAREGLAPSYLTRVLRLAFLAPQVTDAVLDGKLREGASVARLLAVDAIDPLWTKQTEQMAGG
jgi:site-specific DNA recombinase